MHKTSAMLAAAAALLVAGSAQAQICAGYPTTDRQFSFGARADFPEDLDQWGVEASYNFSGPLAVHGGLIVTSIEDIDDSDGETYFAGASFEVASLGAMIGPTVSVCPTGTVYYASEEGDTFWQIPLGVGFGANLSATPSIGIMPYVIPALVITRFDFDDDGPITIEDETETDFGITGGALVNFGMFFVGGEVRHLFVEDSEAVFGIRAGIRL